MIEPVDPFERGDFDGLKRPPWPAPMDDLGLVEAVDGLGECVVIAVADAADGRRDARPARSAMTGHHPLGPRAPSIG